MQFEAVAHSLEFNFKLLFGKFSSLIRKVLKRNADLKHFTKTRATDTNSTIQ